MVPSSAFCRAQENMHRERAEGTPLENVRLIATNAALAWAKEAVAAESREARQLRLRIVADAGDAETFEPDVDEEDDPSASENPDRGLASGSVAA